MQKTPINDNRTDRSRSKAQISVARLSRPQRLELAQVRTKALADRISELVALSEQNRLVVYSPTISGQIPKSFAANAFNVFKQAMLRMELIQVCTFWDKPDETLNQNSIPTVHALVDDDVIELHMQAVQSNWPFGDKQAEDARRSLLALRKQIAETMASPLLSRVKNLRDKHLAHSLTMTRAEARAPVEPAKYGDERDLIDITTSLVESLYLWLNGTDYDLAGVRSMHKRHVEELWTNCTFNIPVR